MARPEDASGARRTDLHPTSELPEYARGSATPGRDRWPGDPGDAIGKPLDTGRFDDAARLELEPRGRGYRGLFWLAGIIAVAAAVVFGLKSVDLFPHFSNPFATKTTDRSQPVVLKSIQDLSRFTAATGNFEVIIDVQNDKKYIPDVLFNERTLFVAVGTVDAYVDFSTIGDGAIIIDQATRKVEIRLPAPQLEPARINHDRSYVFSEQRGLANRIGDLFGGDPNKQQKLYQAGEQKIADAAKASELTKRAQDNTKAMLEKMLKSLGYETVVITFATS